MLLRIVHLPDAIFMKVEQSVVVVLFGVEVVKIGLVQLEQVGGGQSVLETNLLVVLNFIGIQVQV